MRPEGIAAAERELRRAVRAHRRLAEANSFEEAEDAWADFLIHAGRVYNKLRAACHGHPLDWTWWRKKMDERRDDPLLAYVHHCRNSDTHRLDQTTNAAPSHVGYFLVILPVVDKGITYPVPQAEKPDGQTVEMYGELVAFFASAYLEELVREASSRLR
jgi:hypothetical protein